MGPAWADRFICATAGFVVVLCFFSGGKGRKKAIDHNPSAPFEPKNKSYYWTILDWSDQNRLATFKGKGAGLHRQLKRLKLLEIELRPENEKSFGVGYFNSQMDGEAYTDALLADLNEIGLPEFATVIEAEMRHEKLMGSIVQDIRAANPDVEDPYDDPRIPVSKTTPTADIERAGGYDRLLAALNAHFAVRYPWAKQP